MLGYRYHHVESTCTIRHTAHAPVVTTLRVVPSGKRTEMWSASSFGPRCAAVFFARRMKWWVGSVESQQFFESIPRQIGANISTISLLSTSQ